jgi:hypothetical protein
MAEGDDGGNLLRVGHVELAQAPLEGLWDWRRGNEVRAVGPCPWDEPLEEASRTLADVHEIDRAGLAARLLPGHADYRVDGMRRIHEQ